MCYKNKILTTMKVLFTFIMILFSLIGFAQKNKFKNVDKFSQWIMAYQQNPEPEKLFSAFEFGVTNKKIAEAGGRSLVIAFFGSIFRADSTVIIDFYDKVKNANSNNFHYGFLGSLWMANTTYSKIIMDKYLQLESSQKYKSDGIEKERPYDVYNDPISDPSHLDLIWADFFATGNPLDIKRIISVLQSNNSISNAAKWSLTSNGIHYKKVYQIIQSESTENTNDLIRKKLVLIMKDMNNELKK